MLFSAIFKVKNSPLVQLYSQSIEKISKLKSKKILVNEKAIRFAHIIGTIFSGICIIALLFRENIGWGIVFIFAIIKTISAVGICPASKLYDCMNSGSCCTFLKK
jgi:hypothetical protein